MTRSPLPKLPTTGLNVPPSQVARETEALRTALSGRQDVAYINLNARGADQFFIFSAGFTVDGDGNASFTGDVSALSGTFEIVRGGRWDNLATNPTRGIRLDSSVAKPGTWANYIDFAATGTQVMVKLGGLEVRANGSAEFSGELSAATGSFAGDVTSSATVAAELFTAPTATFTGTVVSPSFQTGGPEITYVSVGSFGVNNALSPSSSWALSTGGGGGYNARFDTGVEASGFQLSSGSINITGSRGGNAALASLLTALASIGLITDSTT